ncbi:hypothetical protein ABPG72_016878, partial [Tetrahymena utriculariae]
QFKNQMQYFFQIYIIKHNLWNNKFLIVIFFMMYSVWFSCLIFLPQVYMMWNHYAIPPGVFDFSSPDRNLRNFLQITKEEQMYLLIRPGPYVCAEWDFGVQPYWLLKENMDLRSTDPKYIEAFTPYIKRVAQEKEDYQITRNGTILILQIENEYCYY